MSRFAPQIALAPEIPPESYEPDIDLNGATVTEEPATPEGISAATPSTAPEVRPALTATAKPVPVTAKPVPVTAKPAPATATPATGAGRMIDAVWVEAAIEGRVLAWVNRASESELKAAGIYARGINIILEKRPFSSLDSFAQTPYLGTKSLQAAVDTVRR